MPVWINTVYIHTLEHVNLDPKKREYIPGGKEKPSIWMWMPRHGRTIVGFRCPKLGNSIRFGFGSISILICAHCFYVISFHNNKRYFHYDELSCLKDAIVFWILCAYTALASASLLYLCFSHGTPASCTTEKLTVIYRMQNAEWSNTKRQKRQELCHKKTKKKNNNKFSSFPIRWFVFHFQPCISLPVSC